MHKYNLFARIHRLTAMAKPGLLALLMCLAACIGQEPDAPISVAPVELEGRAILVRNVAVFDAETLSVLPERDVLVKGSTIVSV